MLPRSHLAATQRRVAPAALLSSASASSARVGIAGTVARAQQRAFASAPPSTGSGRSGFRSLLLYTSTGLALFYGGSTYASLVNQKYADFFVEHVPFGEKIFEQVEDTSFARSLKSSNVDSVSNKAAEAATAGYERLSDAVTRLRTQSKELAEDAKEKLTGAEAESKDAVQKTTKTAKDMVRRVEKQVEESKIVEKGEEQLQKSKEKSTELVEKAKRQAEKTEKRVKSDAEKIKGNVQSATESDQLPLQHELSNGARGSASRDRGVRADAGEPEARLRDPPALPKLPKLAPSLSSLSGSEPMIAQLASTIDDLAAFLRDAPANAGAKAGGVLDEAKAELSKLYNRLEAVKKQEAERLSRGLEEQKQKYDAALKKAADEARAKVDKVDEAWKKREEQQRKHEADEYAAKLKAELDTQSQIINERLKEEVVQQGIEMQRRWMKEIKARVEAERGGRLARLDELAKDLDNIQKISLDNSQALEESASALALSAALRELAHKALDETDDANVKQPFDKELSLVKRALHATAAGDEEKTKQSKDDLLGLALKQLEAAKPQEGVETFSTLYAWFSQKVRPAVQRVALVPDQAGVLSHLMSATIAPLLFTKSGYPTEGEHDDVPSVLARTQFHLERHDLDSAARQLNQLKGWPKILAEDWLNAARRRLEVEQHLDMANAEAHYAALQNA